MRRNRLHRMSVGLSLAMASLVLLAGACSGEAGPATDSAVDPGSGLLVESSGSTTLTAGEAAELEARAMARAWNDSAKQPPVCTGAGASPELRAAIAAFFPLEVEYFDTVESIMSGDAPGAFRCTAVSPRPARTLRPEVVGVDVWVGTANLSARAQTYLFRWNGWRWIDSTPEETGVTVTTAVS